MHPDVIIDSLRQELDGLNKNAADHKARRKAIEDEIAYHDGQERPEVQPEQPETVVDHNVGYLAGLKQELEQAAEERKDEIKAEIERVEALIRSKPSEEEAVEPTPEEIEQRKQARANKGVEQARSAPTPDKPAPAETAPAQGAEKEEE